MSDFSRQSLLSRSSHDSAATDSCSIEQDHRYPEIYNAIPSGAQLLTLHKSFQPSLPHQPNQDSLYKSSAAQPPKFFCFACNERFGTKGSLRRHQQEQCERETIFACSLCPLPQAIYYTKERLTRHHISSHGDTCPNDCSKKENRISDLCREYLAESSEKLPSKKAWGCPYCVRCFQAFEEWHRHCTEHLTQADTATTWSFGTMIESLLEQDSLRAACLRHEIPVTNNLSSINEKTCTGLREILEHCKLPSELRARQYCYLSISNAVVRCVFDIIRTGQTFPSQQLFVDLVKSQPLLNQAPHNAEENIEDISYTLEEFLRDENTFGSDKESHYPHLRSDNAATTHPSVNDATLTTLRSSNLISDSADIVKSRSAYMQNEDDPSGGHTRKRGVSLKRSLSNLALRSSSSKSSLRQTMAVPPVPPLPSEAKALNTDRAGAVVHPDGVWPTYPYLGPIPQHRPMSGIVYGCHWS